MSSPHGSQPLATAGAPLHEARAAMILLHGRGADAASILDLAGLVAPAHAALLAPQAAGGTWYPYSFLAPRQQNEPHLSSALERVGSVLALVHEAGITDGQIMILGFSQGACLAADFSARHAARFGAVFVLTGGLIGREISARDHYAGSFEGCPILLSSGDPDPHVPWSRVEETAAIFRDMGATVELLRYPGRPHTISEDELAHIRRRALAAAD